jgi:UDP-glucose 4-epimerase
MNILVTGGAGFIGSHIVDELIAAGHRVHVLDNLSTGHRENVHPHAIFHQADVLDGSLGDVFAAARPEVVIHHAAQIDVQSSLKQPRLDANINIVGTIAILEQCRDHKVRKLVFASSAAVYGTPEYLAVDERHPLKPLSFYGISKLTAEHYIEAFAALYEVDYTILRYANVYGIRQGTRGEGGVVAVFMDKLLQGQQPLIYGNGEQTRDFIYVKDIVRANMAALQLGSRSIYNISGNEQTTVVELLQLMCDIGGRIFNPRFEQARAGDIVHSRLQNLAARTGLDWHPIYVLRQGLQETFDDHKGIGIVSL